MTPSDLINFGAISRMLAGNRSSITRDRVPAKHREKIEELFKSVQSWLESIDKYQ